MEEINCEIHSRLGQIAEIKKSVADIQMELSKPKLKNANKCSNLKLVFFNITQKLYVFLSIGFFGSISQIYGYVKSKATISLSKNYWLMTLWLFRMYYQSSVKHGTLKMAVDDLNQYYIALDFAITRFHREKMKVLY